VELPAGGRRGRLEQGQWVRRKGQQRRRWLGAVGETRTAGAVAGAAVAAASTNTRAGGVPDGRCSGGSYVGLLARSGRRCSPPATPAAEQCGPEMSLVKIIPTKHHTGMQTSIGPGAVAQHRKIPVLKGTRFTEIHVYIYKPARAHVAHVVWCFVLASW
jgi:hypothetical protein